jgi:hypothetical protein
MNDQPMGRLTSERTHRWMRHAEDPARRPAMAVRS